MSIIKFKDVNKYYNDNNIINQLNLEIKEGEFVVLVGPSGCGKTTILKMINSLIKFNSGNIIIKGKDIKKWDEIILRREIGYVIQQIGLLPHKTVEENISYVLTIQGKSKEEKSKRAKELISLVGLDESYLKRYPKELSGGQKQRIGVARALADNPSIVLMDEPFGAVDEIARRKLQEELKNLHRSLNNTIVFVTHDIEEALKLGTRIIVMNNGKIVQDGSANDIVFRPKNNFVKEFFGLKGFKAIMQEEELEKIYKEAMIKNNQ